MISAAKRHPKASGDRGTLGALEVEGQLQTDNGMPSELILSAALAEVYAGGK